MLECGIKSIAWKHFMSEVILYKTKDGHISLTVNLSENTVRLTQKQLSGLFGKNVRTISEHIKNVFNGD